MSDYFLTGPKAAERPGELLRDEDEEPPEELEVHAVLEGVAAHDVRVDVVGRELLEVALGRLGGVFSL